MTNDSQGIGERSALPLADGAVTRRDSGSALIVAMVLLAVMSLAGVTAMQGAVVQERMASGQKTLQDAFFDAESDLLEILACMKGVDGSGRGVSQCQDDYGLPPMGAANTQQIPAEGYGPLDNAVHYLNMTIEIGGGGPGNNGAYECHGEGCEFTPSPGGASASADGTDYRGPEDLSEGGCQEANMGTGDMPVNPDGEDRAGLIIPDGVAGSSPGRGGRPDYVGDPPLVNSSEQYEMRYGESTSAAQDRISTEMDDVAERSEAIIVEPGSTLDITGENGVWIVPEGAEVEIGQDGASGLVLMDGGGMSMSGQSCFAGLVMSRAGGQLDAGGTSAIVGGMVALADGNTPATNGNVSFFYSSNAVNQAVGGGSVQRIRDWRSTYE